jgi:perosamine synthetase
MNNSNIVSFIKKKFNSEEFIPLHAPHFLGNEKKYVLEAIDSTYVSSVGAFVDKAEQIVKEITGSKFAIATVNGTSALHIALKLAGVTQNCEVITQPITFVATCNAISYCGAKPIFIDVDIDTLGMSPLSLEIFLSQNTYIENGKCYNKITKKRIVACVPMHTFGFPCRIKEINDICLNYNIELVEDSAESIGSKYNNQHTGTFGKLGVLSFNGNKIVTSGGGGMIITNDEELSKRAKHITTTAKIPHQWEYNHDEIGYNYRMPNLNAALICAQLEQLEIFIANKRELALDYRNFFSNSSVDFVFENEGSVANYWLNTIILNNREHRDSFLSYSNENKIMTRPIWRLMNELNMYKNCQSSNLTNSLKLQDCVVNLPSSFRPFKSK